MKSIVDDSVQRWVWLHRDLGAALTCAKWLPEDDANGQQVIKLLSSAIHIAWLRCEANRDGIQNPKVCPERIEPAGHPGAVRSGVISPEHRRLPE